MRARENCREVRNLDKLLTVSVAAYNGAATLQRALDSCITPNSDQLEVWIIDDGSTDQTAAIAERYVSRYPELFHLYRQANGGYGSTIEAALQRAKGKYFRTLDCDDWFEAGALENLLPYLASSCSDIVYTNYKTVQDDATLQTYPVCNGMDPDAQYTFEDLRGTDLCMEMHGMTFRTEALRQANLNLPHHCHYTDMLYTFCGVQASQTISFCPVTLYCYRLGRDGQSVSLESYRKHFDNYEKVAFLIAERAQGLTGSSAKEQLLIWRARDVAQHGIEICLRQPRSIVIWAVLRGYDKRLICQYPKIARVMRSKNTRFLRTTQYGLYPFLSWWERRKEK